MLFSVSKVKSCRSVKTFVTSHLYYLVAEWLAQRQSDDRYTLGSFPYSLLDQNTVKDFYKSEKLCFPLFLNLNKGFLTLTSSSALSALITRC